MRCNLLFLSGDAGLSDRLQTALGDEMTVLTVDPRAPESDAVAARYQPHAIMIDAGAHTGTRTALERIASVRALFPDRPLVVIGDEMSAQLILAAFRAGADEFLDRDASDPEIRDALLTRLRQADAGNAAGAAMIHVLSPEPCEEDFDLALNIASLAAASSPERRVLFIDMSLPVTPTHTALGLEFSFTLANALRDMARLDRTFLDSALARAEGTGLYVLPLTDDHAEDAPAASRDLNPLIAILRALFDVVVLHWGSLSRHAVRAGTVGGTVFLGCGPRFSSIRNAKSLLTELRGANPPCEPVLAVHQKDINPVLSLQVLAEATGAQKCLLLRASAAALALAHNHGKPLALASPSPYADALRLHLAETGLLPSSTAANLSSRLLHWLNRARPA